MLVALAGPAMNIALALVSAALVPLAALLPAAAGAVVGQSLMASILINLILALFNMMPVPPLDGGRVAVCLLPQPLASWWARLERWGLFIVVGLFLLLPYLLREMGQDFNPLTTLVFDPAIAAARTAVAGGWSARMTLEPLEPADAAPFQEDAAPDAAGPAAFVLRLASYEGPIDLLLDQARAQKVDLAEISILDLAEQYLAFVEQARLLRLELAADYLVMAAWLAYLKSRLLLPEDEETEQPTAGEMAEALAFQLRRLGRHAHGGGAVDAAAAARHRRVRQGRAPSRRRWSGPPSSMPRSTIFCRPMPSTSAGRSAPRRGCVSRPPSSTAWTMLWRA